MSLQFGDKKSDLHSIFNPLDYPICFAFPLRIAMSGWLGHVPFAMFLIDILRPQIIVELGTHHGVSYCAFCQAVKTLKTSTLCYAVDTWQGDDHSGFYEPEVLLDLQTHHDPLYNGFSRLIQSTFADALKHFADNSIDLLHIDGFHTYESVRNDFERWKPKMSNQGIVLFHDVNVREKDFGVWKLWDELKLEYPSFEFTHSHGLGVLAFGKQYQEGSNCLKKLFECSPEESLPIKEFFQQLGLRVELSYQLQQEKNQSAAPTNQYLGELRELENVKHQLEQDLQSLKHQSEQILIFKDQQILGLQQNLEIALECNEQTKHLIDEQHEQLESTSQELEIKEQLINEYQRLLQTSAENQLKFQPQFESNESTSQSLLIKRQPQLLLSKINGCSAEQNFSVLETDAFSNLKHSSKTPEDDLLQIAKNKLLADIKQHIEERNLYVEAKDLRLQEAELKVKFLSKKNQNIKRSPAYLIGWIISLPFILPTIVLSSRNKAALFLNNKKARINNFYTTDVGLLKKSLKNKLIDKVKSFYKKAIKEVSVLYQKVNLRDLKKEIKEIVATARDSDNTSKKS